MGSIDNLTERFADATAARKRLAEAIASTGPTQAELFQLPKELQTRPLHRFEQIAVNRISGSDAHQQSIAALTDLKRHADDTQSQRVRRYPGIVRYQRLNSLTEHANELIDTVAAFKTELHRLTQSASNKQDARFELLHQLAPNLITMHFYRSPLCLTRTVSKVRFGWVAKRIIAKTDRDTILQKLENSLVNPGKVIHDMPAWRAHIEREITAIDSLPKTVMLRIDRSGGLRPTAFIRFEDGARTQTPANLPLLVNQPKSIEIVPLPDWSQTEYPSAKGELLIPRLHLYRLN